METTNKLTEAQKATVQEYPHIGIESIEDCPKCDGMGETIPDYNCLSCSGTGIKNFDIELTN